MCVFNTVAKVRKVILLLRALQWLPMLFWAKAKIFTMLYKVLHDVESTPHPGLISHWSSCSPCFSHKGLWCKPFVLTRLAPPSESTGCPSVWNAFPTESAWIPSSCPSGLFPKLTFSVTCFLTHRFEFYPLILPCHMLFPCFFFSFL